MNYWLEALKRTPDDELIDAILLEEEGRKKKRHCPVCSVRMCYQYACLDCLNQERQRRIER